MRKLMTKIDPTTRQILTDEYGNSVNPFMKKTFNLTKQQELYKKLKTDLANICMLKAEAAVDEIFNELVEKIG